VQARFADSVDFFHVADLALSLERYVVIQTTWHLNGAAQCIHIGNPLESLHLVVDAEDLVYVETTIVEVGLDFADSHFLHNFISDVVIYVFVIPVTIDGNSHVSAHNKIVDVHFFQMGDDHSVVLFDAVFAHEHHHVEVAQTKLFDVILRLEIWGSAAGDVPVPEDAHDAFVHDLELGDGGALDDVGFGAAVALESNHLVDERAFSYARLAYKCDVDVAGIEPLFLGLLAVAVPAVLPDVFSYASGFLDVFFFLRYLLLELILYLLRE